MQQISSTSPCDLPWPPLAFNPKKKQFKQYLYRFRYFIASIGPLASFVSARHRLYLYDSTRTFVFQCTIDKNLALSFETVFGYFVANQKRRISFCACSAIPLPLFPSLGECSSNRPHIIAIDPPIREDGRAHCPPSSP
ncbi:hypothetical protein HMPREF0262_00208 [Clostridium sp. ATCC 29733]|nr:hypothetical protein HMPREF0262_00208 [Clostridium sp. ATCC 29733]